VDFPFIHKALLQEAVNDQVRCLTCERRCELAEGQAGWCRTRQNQGGTLYTLMVGLVSSLSCNPIEKKPLYHFYPGSVALTAGSWSCNFAWAWRQNRDISLARQPLPPDLPLHRPTLLSGQRPRSPQWAHLLAGLWYNTGRQSLRLQRWKWRKGSVRMRPHHF
jgi:pyruvate formate lyase activating enzyme